MIDLTFKCSICHEDFLPDEIKEHTESEIQIQILKDLPINCNKKHSHTKDCMI